MIKKNNIKIFSFVWMLLFSSPLAAQTVLDDPDFDDDDEEEVDSLFVPIEDEISVRDKQGNEELIEFPEAMTFDLDSLMGLYMSKTYLSTGDCNMKDENPTFTPEEYIERLRRMPTIMEMGYNDIVQRFIDRYMGRLRHSVSYMLGAANFYVPIFEEALEAYQVPLELKYLPVIESALNPKAVSRVGATGLWQFMLGTGKMYGLEVNSLVDERRDPVRASYAAARYLRDLYRIFGDWNLVIAAYNCGPGNINKAIRRSGGFKDYWQLYPYLPAETRGYVPAFIAANYAMTYYCEHNICPMTTKLPLQTDTIVVDRDVHLEQIAAVLDLDIEMLRSLNPQYRRDIVPGTSKKYAIRLPMADTGRFIDMQDSIYNYRTTELLTKRAVVEVNDDQPTFRSKKSVRRGRVSARKSRNARRGRTSAAKKRSTAKRSTKKSSKRRRR
jgi:membrane-bound lytic murein transglycosylase D